ncbi:MAG: SGNH/GDSL hydrolase family protein [Cytophagales bacterium]|nr:SGNH/GDSL hydrolase family protein [Bernardetiaceae bacterium]MDW8205844.1 SGNH/GDSL hydrolase family protein [Cytophagales bacterium]
MDRLQSNISLGIFALIILALITRWAAQLHINAENNQIRRSLAIRDSLARINDSLRKHQRIVAKSEIRKKGKELVFHEKSDKSRHRILLTGDSMGDGLFLAWRKLRKKGNFDIRYQPWYGSTTDSWAKTDKLENMIKDYRPTLVIFSLGANQLSDHQIAAKEDHIREIVRQLGNTNYVWIGPPNWKEDTGINNLIMKHVGKERFFDSRRLHFERRKDGAHPTEKAAAVWADSINCWMERNPHIAFSFSARR